MARLTTRPSWSRVVSVRARIRGEPAADRGFGKAAFRADRPRRQEADIGGEQDGAGDHDLQRDEDRKPDIAEQRGERW